MTWVVSADAPCCNAISSSEKVIDVTVMMLEAIVASSVASDVLSPSNSPSQLNPAGVRPADQA